MKIKTKQKLISVIVSLLLVVYPFAFTANVAYAAPSLPGTPDTPSLPDSPDNPDTPENPDLPGDESPVGTSDTSGPDAIPTTSDSGSSDATTANSDTGADSTNTANTTIDNDTDIGIDNNADVDNLLNVDADSGGNDADKNTGDGSVNTGDATIDGSLETDANSISIGALECSSECGAVSIESLEAANSNTGAGSDNSSNSSVNNESDLDIGNNADFNNLVMFDASSGDNSASYNTGNGSIEVGDAEILLTAINVANNVNVGYEVFNVFDDQTGDIIIDFDSIAGAPSASLGASSSNDTTGADSTNTATTNVDNSNTILIDNNGNIINNYYLDASTGDNTADKNTGDGTITTGDANVVFNLINFLNNAFLGGGEELLLGVVNIFGTLEGNIVLEGLDGGMGTPYGTNSLSSTNDTTGAGSGNDASISLTNDTDITLANSADILNNLSLDATTGDNSADKNTGSGQINSGDTNVNLNVANIANNTGIGDGGTIWMVLVNNLGTWTGQLFDTGAAGGAFSPFFTFTLSADGSLSASNQDTGADSNNEAATSVDNDTDIIVTNTATLTNNVVIDANTGGNSASKNTGSGSISTGDANVAVNIVNMLNNIFLGGRFAITIVNVFGSFFGNIQQGGHGAGTLMVDSNESIAISPQGASSSPNTTLMNTSAGPNQVLGSSPTDSFSNYNSNNAALVLSSNTSGGNSDSLPISRFAADRGLFDDFQLSYLLFPILFGAFFAITKRILFKEVKR